MCHLQIDVYIQVCQLALLLVTCDGIHVSEFSTGFFIRGREGGECLETPAHKNIFETSKIAF